MSDVPDDLDLSQLGKAGASAVAAPPKPQPQVTQGTQAHPSGADQTSAVVMQSPEVPYPVAAPLKPGDPVPTQNHFPWAPLPLAPVEVTPVPKLELPPAPVQPPVVVQSPPIPVGPKAQPAPVLEEVPPEPEPKPEPVQPPKPAAPPPPVQPVAVAQPPVEPQKPVMPPELPHVDIKHIYSVSTQEVWRALKPSKAYGLFLFGSMAFIACLAFFTLQGSGVNLYDIPFIKDTLGL